MSVQPDERLETVSSLSESEFAARISAAGLGVRIGPFDMHLHTSVPEIHAPLYRLYRDYPLLDDERVFSFHASLVPTRRWRPGHRRLVRFSVDGRQPHEDMPVGQALTVLEWGINLVIALRMHCFVMLHAAAVERRGKVMLLPAMPGHGKTTLCTALTHRGWRLFSDEFGLLRPGLDEVIPVPRPMPLKNESIDVIRSFAPAAEFGPTIPNTRKGTIAHVKPPLDCIRDAALPAPVSLVVFPRWIGAAPLLLEELPKPASYLRLATNAFNYELLGIKGFETLRTVIDASRCFDLVYSDLDAAVTALERLSDEHAE